MSRQQGAVRTDPIAADVDSLMELKPWRRALCDGSACTLLGITSPVPGIVVNRKRLTAASSDVGMPGQARGDVSSVRGGLHAPGQPAAGRGKRSRGRPGRARASLGRRLPGPRRRGPGLSAAVGRDVAKGWWRRPWSAPPHPGRARPRPNSDATMVATSASRRSPVCTARQLRQSPASVSARGRSMRMSSAREATPSFTNTLCRW